MGGFHKLSLVHLKVEDLLMQIVLLVHGNFGKKDETSIWARL